MASYLPNQKYNNFPKYSTVFYLKNELVLMPSLILSLDMIHHNWVRSKPECLKMITL